MKKGAHTHTCLLWYYVVIIDENNDKEFEAKIEAAGAAERFRITSHMCGSF